MTAENDKANPPPFPRGQFPEIRFSVERALEIGKAAEHLVCADLILRGYRVFLSDQGLPYDLVIDHHDRLIRVQVKSSIRPKNMNSRGRNERMGYNFSARIRGRKGQSRLGNTHCDIVAFVALDIRQVAYLPIRKVATTMSFSPPEFVFAEKHKRTGRISDFPLEIALRDTFGD